MFVGYHGWGSRTEGTWIDHRNNIPFDCMINASLFSSIHERRILYFKHQILHLLIKTLDLINVQVLKYISFLVFIFLFSF